MQAKHLKDSAPMIEIKNESDFNEYIESLLVNYESDDLEFK